ncbi:MULTISPECIES: hypothetical protein, partial [Pseudomonas]|uniref:hypothetical protein n=1 Tax=Pseudomonas TaxID=286 RepID=UPI002F262F73
WPDARGMGGRITVESVVRCSWNGWPDDREIRKLLTERAFIVFTLQIQKRPISSALIGRYGK